MPLGDGGRKLIYSRPLGALSMRDRMVELIADLKGLRVREPEKPRSGIKVLVVNEGTDHREGLRRRRPCHLALKLYQRHLSTEALVT